jgi:predicted PurR-regulated permease PerM
VSALAKKLPGRSRLLATAIAYIIVVIALLGFIVTVVPTITDQTARFIKTLPGILEGISRQTHWLNDVISRYSLQHQYHEAITNIQSQAAHAASSLGGSFIGSIGSLIGLFATTLLVLVMTFMMLIEGPIWVKKIWSLYNNPVRKKHHQLLVTRMYRVVTGFINGQVLISAISAISSLVVIVILSAVFHMPANIAIPIAVIVFLCGLVPMFGATVGAIIAGLLIAINSITAAIIFLIFYFIYQQIENSFISPSVQSRAVEISALTVIVALTIGLSLFGILGGLISIPIAGCIRVLVLNHLEQDSAKS